MFLRHKMYNNKKILKKNNEGKKILQFLFDKITKKPKKFLKFDEISLDKYRASADYISGMTDRFAINLYREIYEQLHSKIT